MSTIYLPSTPKIPEVSIALPSSKSESNRALIIQALCKEKIYLSNLSPARDTQTMIRLLTSTDEILNVLDAGTTMRFLTAYLTITNQQRTLMGTERMHNRPIGILVDALRSLGAEIDYLDKDGFPPMLIKGLSQQNRNAIQIRGDISSQYISALLMIAPILPQGLTIELTGKVGSRPYIEMTLNLMKHFGVEYLFENNVIKIEHQVYKSNHYKIESDWSAASYWYSFAALAESSDISLMGLRKDSFQGDISIAGMMHVLGVASVFEEGGVRLVSVPHRLGDFHFDFTDCPDLAQTIAVICAAKEISIKMSGLESLRIKETDRIAALQNELAKIDARLHEIEDGVWRLTPGYKSYWLRKELEIETYEDHRMAMAFAPLCTLANVRIKEPSVVKKSYPGFWDDLRKVGIKIKD